LGELLLAQKRFPQKGVSMSLFFILAAILMLGVMVMVHELGHFLAARWTGIPVKEFAIGFGPKLLSWKSKKHETVFFLRLIPAGGYCMFYGEDDAGEKAKDDPRNLNLHAAWKRLLTIAMGPLMNFVLAFVVAVGLYMGVGEDTQGYVGYAIVQSVSENSAAAEAGMAAGDKLLSVNGESAQGMSADGGSLMVSQLISAYEAGDAPLLIEIQRGEEVLTVPMAPRYSEADGRYMIGVTLNYEYTPGYTPISIFRAVELGADYCLRASTALLDGLKTMITTGEGFEESSGPVGIIQLIAEETQANGWLVYIQLLVMISINLGLFNLIPIPGLDGSRMIFLLIEIIFRKPIPRKLEAYVHMAGYLLLIGLMLVMTYKDILKIFR